MVLERAMTHECVAGCCSVLHYDAVCCRVLQCVAVYCSAPRKWQAQTLLERAMIHECVAVRCSVLQYVALQHVAVYLENGMHRWCSRGP